MSFEFEGEVELKDILRLGSLPANSPPPLQEVKAVHRRQAMLLAEGKKVVEVASLVGSTPGRIYQLLKDPGFREIVGQYSKMIEDRNIEASERYQEKLTVAGEASLDELNDRLADPHQLKKIPTGELRQIIEMAADRTHALVKAPLGAQTQAPPSITLNFGTSLKPRKEIDHEQILEHQPLGPDPGEEFGQSKTSAPSLLVGESLPPAEGDRPTQTRDPKDS